MPPKNLDADVEDFLGALALLTRRLRAVGSPEGLSWTESIVVKRLAKEGPATTAELAREVGVKPQSMGTTVASLAERGLLERKPHPSDRRQVNIALSAKGSAAHKNIRDARRSWLAAAAAGLDERGRDGLAESAKLMQRLAEA